MNKKKPIDINGREIKHNDLVRVADNPKPSHAWLREGNTLRVAWWEEHGPFGVIVFMKSKGAGLMCGSGLQCGRLEVLESDFE